MRYIGVALSIVMLAGFFAARGKLNRFGLEFFAWNETRSENCAGYRPGRGCSAPDGLAVPGHAHRYDSAVAEVWIGITFRAARPELVFRGRLFHGIASALKRWLARPGWLVVFVVAALFAVSHLARVGITPVKLAPSFLPAAYSVGCAWTAARPSHLSVRT